MSSVNESLKVYRNPFSKATTNPKIPDGKAVVSVGVKKIWTRSFGMDEQPYNIILYPGLTGGFFMELGDAVGNVSFNADNRWSDNHGTYITTGSLDPIASQGSINQVGRYINKWRLVSQGLRLSSTKGTLNNGGWWESVRIPLPTGQDNYVIAASGASLLNGPAPLVCMPNANLGLPTWRNTDGSGAWGMQLPMTDNPTYQSGNMEDLDHLVFKNKPVDTHHPFCTPKDHYAFTAGFAVSTNKASGVHSMRTEDTPSIVTDLIDHSFDAVLIRLHPAADAQNMLVHLESNQEVIYDETEQDRVHHSVSMADVDKLRAIQKGHSNIVAPATVHSHEGMDISSRSIHSKRTRDDDLSL